MADFGNIAGVVKHHLEPKQTNLTPKTFVIWAKETTAGSNEVTLMRYDFINSKWVPLSATSSYHKVDALQIDNIALTGVTSVDGIALTNGNRVLLIGQTDWKQNGVWMFNTGGNLTRPLEYSLDVAGDHIIYVNGGNTHANKMFSSNNPSNLDGFIVGVDNLTFKHINSISPSAVSSNGSTIRIISTNSPTGSEPLTNGQVSLFNTSPAISIAPSQEVYVRHRWTQSGKERFALLKLNKPADQTTFGAGNSPVATTDFVLLTNLDPQVFHPDEIGLNGMGNYNFGFTGSNLTGNGNTQETFNRSVELLSKDCETL